LLWLFSLPFIYSGCKVELHKGLSENVKCRKDWQKRADHIREGREGVACEGKLVSFTKENTLSS